MREIREVIVRGKRTDCGEWVEGDLLHYESGEMAICKGFSKYGYEATEIIGRYKVLPETVGQYTGLTDKNGVRIFEGDIVKGIAYSVERIGAIVWIDEIASFGVRYFKSQNPTTWENSSILRCASMGKTDEFAAEIIGNIHDNPELLEGGEGNESNSL